MPLSELTVRKAGAESRAYKMADEKGLYVLVTTGGAKSWRLDYSFSGKRKTIVLGQYPETTLKRARELRDELRIALAEGKDPMEVRREERIKAEVASRNTFKEVGEDWFEKERRAGQSQITLDKKRWIFDNKLTPLHSRPIDSIKAPEVLAVLRRCEQAGLGETTRRARGIASKIFRYGIVTFRCESDPAAFIGDALTPAVTQSYVAITDRAEFSILLAKLDTYDCWRPMWAALKAMVYNYTRTKELRYATWDEFDLEKNVWVIPVERMKKRRHHEVPITRQFKALIESMEPYRDSRNLVFPPKRSQQPVLSENFITSTLHRLGYAGKMTGHGFRSSASTILNENEFDPEWIEVSLAHVDQNSTRRVYNRARYFSQRMEMAQAWADMVDEMVAEGKRRLDMSIIV